MRIGIDLGGTKTEGIVLNHHKDILWRDRITTPKESYPAILQSIQDLLHTISQEMSIPSSLAVGIGTPGSLNKNGLIKNCNNIALNNKPLLADLKKILKRPITIANDANCFALSEAHFGAATNYKNIFGVIIGTGVGGGIIIDKKLINGPNGISGEWGHSILPGVGTKFNNENRLCYCGRKNCIETYLSGSGLSKTYLNISGKKLDAITIAQLATINNQAQQAINLYQQQLAYSLSQVINLLDPDAIVLGGGLSSITSLYSAIPKLWADDIFSDTIETHLLKAKYGDSSGVLGAAFL